MKRNNAVPHNHFKKTALMYKTWFGQPAGHQRRRKIRAAKAKQCFPMPLEKLRPVVRCPTIRYNKKLRMGRGFTAEECKAADLDYLYARTIGISVDLRRRNGDAETFERNVQRLKDYVSNLVFYNSKQEAMDSAAVQHVGDVMPLVREAPVVQTIAPSEVAAYN